jgi:hypothetical protein
MTPEFIRHDLPEFATATPQQPFEEPLGGSAAPAGLQKHINHFTILVDFVTLHGSATAKLRLACAIRVQRQNLLIDRTL